MLKKILFFISIISISFTSIANDFSNLGNNVFSNDNLNKNNIFEQKKQISKIEIDKKLVIKREALPVDEAFNVSINEDDKKIKINFEIQPEHHIYLPKLKIKLNNIEFNDFEKPKSYKVHDMFFGDIEVIKDSFDLLINNLNIKKVEIEYQGCAESVNVCYPQINKIKYFDESFKIEEQKELQLKEQKKLKITDFEYITNVLNNSSIYKISLFFLVFGILVSFTPCILPTLPIISTIIMSQNKKTKLNAFKVSSIYVLGNATAYTVVGVFIALLSFNIQVSLQNPFIIMLAIAILAALYLSLSGKFFLGTPTGFSSYVNEKINKISNGNILGIYSTGFLSTMIVSTCMAVPLAAAIMYISTTGNVLIGAVSMFSFGIGSGLLLIIISTQLNTFKIKNMAIAEEAKHFMGYLILIAIALMIERISSNVVMNACLIIFTLYYCKDVYIRNSKKLKAIIFIISLILMNVYYVLTFGNINIQNETIKEITSVEQYQIIKKENKKVIIKFTADWCTYCLKMQNEYLNEKAMNEQYSEYKIYKVDLTEISNSEQLLLNILSVYAPPTILIINNGYEIKSVGYMDKERFSKLIKNSEGKHYEDCGSCDILKKN